MALPKLPTVNVDKTTKMVLFLMIAAVLLMPTVGLAQDVTGDTGKKVCTFFQSINGLLNAASIVVVTIAVIFSGYQIAFAHKRIADVAPALIGGVLIGAAAQVAKMVVGGDGGASNACTSASGSTTFLIDAIQMGMNFLHFHA